jgi:Holliday junction resolvase YEN1
MDMNRIPSTNKEFNDEFTFFSRAALEELGLLQGGFLLLALLSGGDYDHGIEGCGATTALDLAKCGFGAQLLDALTEHRCHKSSDEARDNFLVQWRAGIQHELTNNSSAMLSCRQAKLASRLPETFPSPAVHSRRAHAEPAVTCCGLVYPSWVGQMGRCCSRARGEVGYPRSWQLWASMSAMIYIANDMMA